MYRVDTRRAVMMEKESPHIFRHYQQGVENRSMGVVSVRFEAEEMFINNRKVVEHLPTDNPCRGEPLPDSILYFLWKEQTREDVSRFLRNLKAQAYWFLGTVYHGPNDYAYLFVHRVICQEGVVTHDYWCHQAQKGVDLGPRDRLLSLVLEVTEPE